MADDQMETRGWHALPAAAIERQTTSGVKLSLYIALLVVFDVGKLITSYALKYYNNDLYPVAQTLIVFLAEDTKLALLIGGLVYTGSHREVSLSLKFAIPSTLYAINNNLYLYAFHYTTPAVWNVLMQSRIVITAIVYRVLFKKHITRMQWLSLCLLTGAISMTQLTGSSGSTYVKPEAFVLVAISSTLSVAAAIFMEWSFKNDKRSFMDQQLQLCLFAAVISLVLYRLEATSGASEASNWWVGNLSGAVLPVLFGTCVVLGAISGLVTGVVIKKLDNIVKIYSQALCGIVNAILCMLIFPSKFSPDWRYFASLILVIASIMMYERGCHARSRQFLNPLERKTQLALADVS